MFLNFCPHLTFNRHILCDFFKNFLQFFPTTEFFMSILGNLKQNFDFLSILRAFLGLYRSFFFHFWHFLPYLRIKIRYLAHLNIILIYFFNHLCGFRPLLDYFIDASGFFKTFFWLFEFPFDHFFIWVLFGSFSFT